MKTMKVETREDALLHCFDLWLWLAGNPNLSKWGWPGWTKNGGYLKHCYMDCPCCELFYTEKSCHECPLKWSNGGRKYMCERSEYGHWRRAVMRVGGVEGRKKWALEIAILALEGLSTK